MAGPGLVVVVLVVSGGSMCRIASRGPLCLASSRADLARSSSDDSLSLDWGLPSVDSVGCVSLVGAALSDDVGCGDSSLVVLLGSEGVAVPGLRACEVLSFGIVSVCRG